jgi:hypothetical protein
MAQIKIILPWILILLLKSWVIGISILEKWKWIEIYYNYSTTQSEDTITSVSVIACLWKIP